MICNKLFSLFQCLFNIKPLFIDRQTFTLYRRYEVLAIYPNDVNCRFEMISKKKDKWKLLIKASNCLSDPPLCIIIKKNNKLIIDYIL